MTSLFLDTGYVIRLEAADDQNHKTVSRHWQNLSKSMPQLVTTSYVFDELVTFFNSRNRNAKAVEIGNRLLTSPTIKLVHVDEALFFEGWNLLVQRDDKTYSLTDCISFSVMTNTLFKKGSRYYHKRHNRHDQCSIT
jgi:predicted nucleic acid-binding protein